MLIRSTIHSLKNFLLVGDVFKSSYMLYYYQQDYVLCCVLHTHLGFITTDSMRNLCVSM